MAIRIMATKPRQRRPASCKAGRRRVPIDAALTGLDRYLEAHHDELRERLGWHVPWWIPLAVEDRIYERLFEAARGALRGMATNPEHHLRRELDARLVQLAVELETSPSMRERGEQLKLELLSQPQLRDWVATLWNEAKERLRASACDPDSRSTFDRLAPECAASR